jgi:putative addiction module killer protein
MLFVKSREARKYVRADGSCPFDQWFESVPEVRTRVRIERRIRQMEGGNLGDYRILGEGLIEARIDFGPGWRVYFGFAGRDRILLLIGGSKRNQERDIKKARGLWRDYETRQKSK